MTTTTSPHAAVRAAAGRISGAARRGDEHALAVERARLAQIKADRAAAELAQAQALVASAGRRKTK